MTIETPPSCTRRITSTALSISAGLRPARASSSSSTFGSAASARAISSSCRWCRLSEAGYASARRPRPTVSSGSVASRRATASGRGERPNMSAIATLSRTVIDANGFGIW